MKLNISHKNDTDSDTELNKLWHNTDKIVFEVRSSALLGIAIAIGIAFVFFYVITNEESFVSS